MKGNAGLEGRVKERNVLMGLHFSQSTQPSKPPHGRGDDPQDRHEAPAPVASVQDEIEETLSRLLPWGLSILIHVALVLVAIAVVWSTTTLEEVDDLPTPTVTLQDAPPLELNTVVEPRPRDPKLQDDVKRPAPRADTLDPRQILNPHPTDQPVLETGVFGALWGGGLPDGLTDVTPGGDTIFGPPAGQLPGVKKVVYVIDASGSLIDTLPLVIDQLQTSVMQLSDDQSFTVIFYQDDKTIEAQPAGLKPADRATKQRVVHVDGHRQRPHHPHRQLKPDAGDPPGPAVQAGHGLSVCPTTSPASGSTRSTRRTCSARSPAANTGHTKINTIQFLYHDRLARIGMTPTMKLISQETGGDLQIPRRPRAGDPVTRFP